MNHFEYETSWKYLKNIEHILRPVRQSSITAINYCIEVIQFLLFRPFFKLTEPCNFFK